jgi:hypothetical protein
VRSGRFVNLHDKPFTPIQVAAFCRLSREFGANQKQAWRLRRIGTPATRYDRTVARNITKFDSGNRIGLKLTLELSSLFVNTIKITGRLSVAAGRCDIAVSTARDWLRKGRLENAEPIYREFATAVTKAHAEFLAINSEAAGATGDRRHS